MQKPKQARWNPIAPTPVCSLVTLSAHPPTPTGHSPTQSPQVRRHLPLPQFRSPSPLLWCPAACRATTSALSLPRPSMAAASFARALLLLLVVLLLAGAARGKTVKRDGT